MDVVDDGPAEQEAEQGAEGESRQGFEEGLAQLFEMRGERHFGFVERIGGRVGGGHLRSGLRKVANGLTKENRPWNVGWDACGRSFMIKGLYYQGIEGGAT